jgi:hypothetical protein
MAHDVTNRARAFARDQRNPHLEIDADGRFRFDERTSPSIPNRRAQRPLSNL